MTGFDDKFGARNIFVPGVNAKKFGGLINRFFRSFANKNITKFSILPHVPHGVYLGGFLDGGRTSVKTSSIYGGFRRLPILGGANGSIFSPTPAGTDKIGAQYFLSRSADILGDFDKNVIAINNNLLPTGTEEPIINLDDAFSLRTTKTGGSEYEEEIDYNIFDMSKTLVWPINQQYPFITTPGRGYTPFHDVCEINLIEDRDPRDLYYNFINPSSVTTISPRLTSIPKGGLFCAQYYYLNGIDGGDNISVNSSSVIKTGDLARVNAGSAHVLYIEFGDDGQTQFGDS